MGHKSVGSGHHVLHLHTTRRTEAASCKRMSLVIQIVVLTVTSYLIRCTIKQELQYRRSELARLIDGNLNWLQFECNALGCLA